MKYDFFNIEAKWQKYWNDNKTFSVKIDKSKPKFYALVEFPYPSGAGLHVGHPRPYTAMDVISRKRRLEGYNVLFPIGWDAFGLPAENFAIKNHVHPSEFTAKNIARFKKQIQSLGLSFDWEREINTTDPSYYKWTQWIFIQLFKKGLAYKKKMPVNWCPNCKVVLANEEAKDGLCERCHNETVTREKEQWALKIPEFAEELIDGLDSVDYLERIKTSQINWIGKSVGAEVNFKTIIDNSKENNTENSDVFTVYTTRPDTLFGVTYMVISPEHPLLDKWLDKNVLSNSNEIISYRKEAAGKSELLRAQMEKEKTGVKLSGVLAINPLNNEKIPIFVSDYVLMSYGTGAIMAVPAHDTRDHEFAKKFALPIIEVVKSSKNIQEEAFTDCDSGEMVNSDFLNGLSVEDAKIKIRDFLEEKGIGKRKVNYKLRDWLFARQRYWGEPIPIVKCQKCGFVAVPEEELPIKLPEVENYLPTDDGSSPLSSIESFVKTTCPCCKGEAERETDTMPQWAGSSWYFLRYCDPNNDNELISKDALSYFMPVDWYNGGMEHTTLHLLYSRFWHKFLYSIGVTNTKEPYSKRTAHGMILAQSGKKMAKSEGTAINPDEVVEQYGADTFRLYEMFIGDFEKNVKWDPTAIIGCQRFIERIISFSESFLPDSKENQTLSNSLNKTIKKVTEDIESMKFNTAIASIMSLLNDASKIGFTREQYKKLLIITYPFAPHITEELYNNIYAGFIHNETWCEPGEIYEEEKIEIAVQICGKIRKKLEVKSSLTKEELLIFVKENCSELFEGKNIVKEIAVPGKLVNFVVK